MWRVYRRVLKYVFAYWRWLVGSVVSMLFFVFFSAFSLTVVMPFINVLFQPETSASSAAVHQPARVQQPGKSNLPVPTGKLPDLRRQFEQKLNQLLASRPKKQSLTILCVVIAVGFFFKNLFRVGQAYFMAPVEQGVIRDLRSQLFRHYQRLSLRYFAGERAGQLISRVIYDVSVINASITAAINSFFRDPLQILIYLGIMLFLSWKLTLLVLIVFPVVGYAMSEIGNRLKRDSLRMQERVADLASVLQETIYGIRVVRAFGTEEREISRFDRENDDFFRTVVRMARIRNLGPAITEYLGVLVGVLVLYVGGLEVLGNQAALSPGGFVLFLGALFSMMQPLKFLGQVHNSLREGMVAAERVFGILDTAVEIQDHPDAVDLEDFRHSVRYVNVSFAYDDVPVLRDINLEVRKGEMLAIVGPSGAGKSTLVDLLMRFYDPTEGRLEIDGVDLRRVRLASLRRLMAMVTQETILFNDTVRNNIAYGTDGVTEEQIIEAAKAANAHHFIMEMPQGYDTVIGDRGVRLSGGERQRLAIARAILRNPPILILDEATSALDTESEIMVQQAIERLLEGRTSFVIAHRLSTVRNADRIVVLQEGRIVEEGRHDELLARDGLYRKLYVMQFAGEYEHAS